MRFTKAQIQDLLQGWHCDPEQPENWLRFDKGIKDTSDTVCYAYFVRVSSSVDLWVFNRFEIQ